MNNDEVKAVMREIDSMGINEVKQCRRGKIKTRSERNWKTFVWIEKTGDEVGRGVKVLR